ncbi:MAG: NPCBM/NEW2 domain-containing protein [Chloroflexota bacterium]
MRRSQQLISSLAALAVVATTLLTGRGPTARDPAPAADRPDWLYLSNLTWQRAVTGSLMVGNEGLPAVDGQFYTGEPIVLSGRTYVKGYGVYTPSEIVHAMHGEYVRFQAVLGVTDDGLPGVAGARFLIYLDGALAFESPSMDKDTAPLHVELPLAGIEELRLVTERSPASERGARAVWAGAQVLPAAPREAASDDDFIVRLRGDVGERAQQRAAQRRRLAAQAQSAIEAARQALPKGIPPRGELPAAQFDPANGLMTVANDRLVVQLGYGGPANGTLTLLDVRQGQYIADRMVASVKAGVSAMPLNRTTTFPGRRPEAAPTAHPVLGPGVQVEAPYSAADGIGLVLRVRLFRDSPVVLFDLQVSGLREGVEGIDFQYVDSEETASFYIGQEAQYLTDLARLRHVQVPDDGLTRQDLVGWGKPVYLWSGDERRGALLALLGETTLPPAFSLRLTPGSVAARMGFGGRLLAPEDGFGAEVTLPTFYLEATAGDALQSIFAIYRALVTTQFPPPPLPDWFKYQWLSWYVYYMDISEDALVREIDFLADRLADLGPWHIIVDAGWYVAEGRDGSEWRNQDREKFPQGIKWLVDYAHRRGVKVVLYFNAPGVDRRQAQGDWMGLRALVEEHPEWLIPLRDGPDNEDFMYNVHHPGLRAYIGRVMDDYLLEYGVDGIKLDGLGNAWDSVFYTKEGGPFALSDRVLAQTMDVYRLVYEQAQLRRPGVYLESGWVTPVMANAFSHTFRYGDEDPVFSRPYPLPGLVEHIDYTAYQQGMLGQRSNIGAIYGDPNESQVNRWWLGAALALGAQVAVSVPHSVWNDQLLSDYRALLAPYRPFEGNTIIDDQAAQQVFSTRVDGVTRVGVLNRELGPRDIRVESAALQLEGVEDFVAYDVEEHRAFTGRGGLTLTLPAETFRLLMVRTTPGVLWANCNVSSTGGSGQQWLDFEVTAPPGVDGWAHIHTPAPRAVFWDGRPMERGLEPDADGAGFTYDYENAVLTVWFPPGGRHLLRVQS